MKRNRVLKGLMLALCATAAIALFGFVVMSLWNWLMPALFGFRLITFWQAMGLLILSKIFFGGFRGQMGSRRHWERRMIDRWERMTPEEREKFRQGMRSRCGPFGAPAAESKP